MLAMLEATQLLGAGKGGGALGLEDFCPGEERRC